VKKVPVALCVLSLASLARAEEAVANGSISVTSQGKAEAAGSADGAETERARKLRAGATYLGEVGGVHVVDAGSGAPGSFRLNLASDFFKTKKYLKKGDENSYVGGALSLGITPIDHLELTAALTVRSNHNDAYAPSTASSLGNPRFGLKTYFSAREGVTLGADVSAAMVGDQSGTGVAWDGTSVGLRANAAFDLRELASLPLQLRANVGYVFDNSAESVSGLEKQRRAELRAAGATPEQLAYEDQVNRHERLGLGINRLDHASFALGAEVPLELGGVGLHPIVEWQLDLPVNRQGFDCQYLVTSSGKRVPGTDGCLAKEGFGAMPQRVTLGARLWPFQGLNLLAAVDIGLGNTNDFVQELAPSAPYALYLAAGYTVDTRAPEPRVVTVVEKQEAVVAPAPEPVVGRVLGQVVSSPGGERVGDAKITFVGTGLTPLWGGVDGTFVGYELAPGSVSLEVEAAGYERGSCSALIPPQGGDVRTTCTLAAKARAPEAVTLAQDKLELKEVIAFTRGTAEIDAGSAPLVEQIAALLVAHPEVSRVEVQGHADDTGSKQLNRGLSERRAASVLEALVKAGVARERLTSKGYGKDKPLVEGDSEEARAKNRRVEIVILERKGE
jgi:outer membrane protein OmpA-like peptidoglycan-associated protein